MHIHAPGLQSIWQAPLAPPVGVAASTAVSAAPTVGAASAIDTGQSFVAAINGGSLFHNLLSQLMQQQGLTSADVADASDSFQNFLQALTPSLAAGQVASTSAASGAGRFGQSGLENNIRSLMDAVGGGQNTGQVAQLTTTFKSLMTQLGPGSHAGSSSQNGNLSLQQVLHGMLQNVQQQGAPAAPGQLVDTFA